MTIAGPLVDATELRARIDAPGTVVLDCRFKLTDPPAGRREYEAGHIPSARYADLDRDLARRPAPHEGRHPLPTPEAFAATLGALGVMRDSDVVVYDDAGGAIAARAWWMLRWLGHANVAVLDGGLAAWLAAGYALETGAGQWSSTRYEPYDARASAWVTTAALPELLERGAVLLDARAAARFRGEVEPIDPVAGHVPGALNLPFDRVLDAEGRFLDLPALREVFAAALEGAPAVAMCGSGVTACHLLLAMARAGLPEGTLYAGSWSEWIRDPARPVARGDGNGDAVG